ncbi:MAG: hypothetical protein ACLUNZ_06260 [Evtepia sp.]
MDMIAAVEEAPAHLRRRRGPQPGATRSSETFAETHRRPCGHHRRWARGGFPARNPLSTGMIGMHGSQASNMACDALRPAHRRGLPLLRPCGPETRHLRPPAPKSSRSTSTAREINKNVQTDHHIIGDAQRVLELLNCRACRQHDHDEWKAVRLLLPTQRRLYDETDDHLTPSRC